MSQTQPQQQTPQQPQKTGRGKGFGVAALVLGIVALVFSFIPVVGAVAFFLGPIAVVFGILGLVLRKGSGSRGTSIAGLILGAVAVIAAAIVFAITAAVVSGVGHAIATASAEANATHTVKYTATITGGAGKGTVTYGSTSMSQKDVVGTFSDQKQETGTVLGTMTVSRDYSDNQATVSCEVFVDGKSVSKNTGDSMVTCSAMGK